MIKREYYDNGWVRSELILDDQGQRHGMIRAWWENKQLFSESPYHRGQLHGTEKGWHENGTPQFEITYRRGRKHGTETWWDKNGVLRCELFFHEGMEYDPEKYQYTGEQLVGKGYKKSSSRHFLLSGSLPYWLFFCLLGIIGSSLWWNYESCNTRTLKQHISCNKIERICVKVCEPNGGLKHFSTHACNIHKVHCRCENDKFFSEDDIRNDQ